MIRIRIQEWRKQATRKKPFTNDRQEISFSTFFLFRLTLFLKWKTLPSTNTVSRLSHKLRNRNELFLYFSRRFEKPQMHDTTAREKHFSSQYQCDSQNFKEVKSFNSHKTMDFFHIQWLCCTIHNTHCAEQSKHGVRRKKMRILNEKVLIGLNEDAANTKDNNNSRKNKEFIVKKTFF